MYTISPCNNLEQVKTLTDGESFLDLLLRLVQSMIGVITKDTKSSVEQTQAIDSAVELEKLFSSRPFTIPSTNSRSKSSAESSSSHLEIGTVALVLVASNCISDIIQMVACKSHGIL